MVRFKKLRTQDLFLALLICQLMMPPSLALARQEKEKKPKFISFETWMRLSEAQRKEIKDKIRAIPSPKRNQRSKNEFLKNQDRSVQLASTPTLFKSVAPNPIHIAFFRAFSWMIPEAMAGSNNSVANNYDDYTRTREEYWNNCQGRMSLSSCQSIEKTINQYETKPSGSTATNSVGRPTLQAQSNPNYPNNRYSSPFDEVDYSYKGSSPANPSGGSQPSGNSGAQPQAQKTNNSQAHLNPVTEQLWPTPPSNSKGNNSPPSQADTTPTHSTTEANTSTSSDISKSSRTRSSTSLTSEEKRNLRGDRNEGGLRYAREQGVTDRHCDVSAKIDGSYGCQATMQGLKNTQDIMGISMITQQMGGQVLGMNAMSNAQRSGTMAGGMNAAAEAQSVAAKAQLATGLITTAMGWTDFSRGRKHDRQRDALDDQVTKFKSSGLTDEERNVGVNVAEGDMRKLDAKSLTQQQIQALHSDGRGENEEGYLTVKDQGSLAAKIVNNNDNFRLNEGSHRLHSASDAVQAYQTCVKTNPTNPTACSTLEAEANRQIAARADSYRDRYTDMTKQISQIGSSAASEQAQVAAQAKGQGIQTMMMGASQMIGGYAGMVAADLNKNSAKQLANIKPYQFTPPPNNQLPINPGDALAASAPTAISPGSSGASDTSGANSGEESSTNKDISLGDPTGFQNAPTDLANKAPAPPSLAPNTGGGGPGGAGGSAGGAGAKTPPSTGGGEEAPQPRMADSRGIPPYEGGGGGQRGGGGGGDRGPDLSGLLAQFLPKQGDDQGGNKNGIMDYGGGPGRAPSSDDGSLLDRNINIFERVHQAYQDKQKKRRVGI